MEVGDAAPTGTEQQARAGRRGLDARVAKESRDAKILRASCKCSLSLSWVSRRSSSDNDMNEWISTQNTWMVEESSSES